VLTVILGILVGLALGLTGGGGSLFAVPLLVYVLHIQPQAATTISLAAITVVAAIGAVEAGFNKMIEWRASLYFLIGGIVAAPVGVRIADRLDGSTLITGFAILMLLIAVSMWYRAIRLPEQLAVVRVNFLRQRDEQSAICQLSDDRKLSLAAPCTVVLMVSGLITGLLSGLFGVGGGFLIVPALIFITDIGINRAVATSLAIITMIGLSGVLSAIGQGRALDTVILGLFILGGIIGMLLGRLLARQIPALLLQKIFSVFILLIALLTLTTRLS
jgi:uncharacterized membrane protein YfcA